MIGLIHPIPAFTDNYIWAIHCQQSNSVCVVDPGDAEPVIKYLQDNQLSLTDILITHHHPDHVGGLDKLIQLYEPLVYGPESSGIRGISSYVSEGDVVELFETSLSVLEVPGHTLDHLAYFSENIDTPVLFCGDTLFAAGCGRLFEGTAEMMQQSLRKLTSLPDNTLVYCTHEYTMANLKFAIAADPHNQELKTRQDNEQQKRNHHKPTLPSNLALELKTNPFLRCESIGVSSAVGQHFAESYQTPLDTFTALRRWKDNF